MKNQFHHSFLVLLTGIFLLISGVCIAKTDLSTPRSAIEEWNEADKLNGDGAEIRKLLPTGSSQKSARLAVQLHQVFQGRGIVIDVKNIPDNQDYIDSTSKEHRYILNSRLPEVYLEKTNGKWSFSESTIEAIPVLHKKVYPLGADIIVNLFPYVKGKEILGLQPWQWLGLALVMVVFTMVILLSKYIFRYIISRFGQMPRYQDFLGMEITRKMSKSLARLVAFYFLAIFFPALQLSPERTSGILKIIGIAVVITTVRFIFNLVEMVGIYLSKMAKNTDSTMDDQFIPVIKKIIKLLVFVSGVLVALNILNVNITAVIAGVSIGGLAFALAAQDTVKNLIGSIMIFADRPFKVGDYIKGSDIEGTVIEVGIRSTLIKTPLQSTIYIPNGRLADMTLDNKGSKIPPKFTIDFELPLYVPYKAVEIFREGLIHIIQHHPRVQNTSVEIFIKNISGQLMTVNGQASLKNTTRKELPGVRTDLYFKCLAWIQQCRMDLPKDGSEKIEIPEYSLEELRLLLKNLRNKEDSETS